MRLLHTFFGVVLSFGVGALFGHVMTPIVHYDYLVRETPLIRLNVVPPGENCT